MAAKIIPFHEAGVRFTWSPATKEVRTYQYNTIVAKNVPNIQKARDAATAYLRRS